MSKGIRFAALAMLLAVTVLSASGCPRTLTRSAAEMPAVVEAN